MRENPHPHSHTIVGRPQFFAGCCPRPSVPNHGIFYRLSECPHNVATGFPKYNDFPNDPREHVPNREATVFLQPSILSDISLLLPSSIH